MQRKVLMDLIEIKSAIASVLPFIIGVLYTSYHHITLDWVNIGLFFLAAVAFHLATNVWDNLQDYLTAKHATFKAGVNDVIGRESLTKQQVEKVLLTLMIIATGLGLLVWVRVGGIVWPILAILSYGVGFLYSGGPKPISRTPLGETFSGLTMGFVIVLMVVLVNNVKLTGSLVWTVFITAAIGVFSIANIMLANNIGDYQEDLKEDRHTLVYYLGQTKALYLYLILYTCGYLSVGYGVLVHILPWPTLLSLIGILPIVNHFKYFWQDRTKKGSFILPIQNTVIIMGLYIIGLLMAIIFSF